MKKHTWKISSGHLVPCGKQAWLDQIVKMFVLLLRVLNVPQYDTVFLGNIFWYLTIYIWFKSFIFLYTRNFPSICCLFLSSYRLIFSTFSLYMKRGIMFRLTLPVLKGWIDHFHSHSSNAVLQTRQPQWLPQDTFNKSVSMLILRVLDWQQSLGASCRSQVTG